MTNLSVRMNGVMPSANFVQTQKNNSIAFKGLGTNFTKSVLPKSQNYLKKNWMHLFAQAVGWGLCGYCKPEWISSLNDIITPKILVDISEVYGLIMAKGFNDKIPSFGVINNPLNIFALPWSIIKESCKVIAQAW